jgi:hypothetical protein
MRTPLFKGGNVKKEAYEAFKETSLAAENSAYEIIAKLDPNISSA